MNAIRVGQRHFLLNQSRFEVSVGVGGMFALVGAGTALAMYLAKNEWMPLPLVILFLGVVPLVSTVFALWPLATIDLGAKSLRTSGGTYLKDEMVCILLASRLKDDGDGVPARTFDVLLVTRTTSGDAKLFGGLPATQIGRREVGLATILALVEATNHPRLGATNSASQAWQHSERISKYFEIPMVDLSSTGDCYVRLPGELDNPLSEWLAREPEGPPQPPTPPEECERQERPNGDLTLTFPLAKAPLRATAITSTLGASLGAAIGVALSGLNSAAVGAPIGALTGLLLGFVVAPMFGGVPASIHCAKGGLAFQYRGSRPRFFSMKGLERIRHDALLPGTFAVELVGDDDVLSLPLLSQEEAQWLRDELVAFVASTVGKRCRERTDDARTDEQDSPQQVVGSSCIHCLKRIAFAVDGALCKKCNRPVHRSCRKGHRATAHAEAEG